jgi:hypothetical protein
MFDDFIGNMGKVDGEMMGMGMGMGAMFGEEGASVAASSGGGAVVSSIPVSTVVTDVILCTVKEVRAPRYTEHSHTQTPLRMQSKHSHTSYTRFLKAGQRKRCAHCSSRSHGS